MYTKPWVKDILYLHSGVGAVKLQGINNYLTLRIASCDFDFIISPAILQKSVNTAFSNA